MEICFPLHILSDRALKIFSLGLRGQGLRVAPKFSHAWLAAIESERTRRFSGGPTSESFELPEVAREEYGEVSRCFETAAEFLPELARILGQSHKGERADLSEVDQESAAELIVVAELCTEIARAVKISHQGQSQGAN